MGYWYKGPAARDANHVAHLCIGSHDGVPNKFLVPCTGRWVRFDAHAPAYTVVDDMVTCIECVMFVVFDGRISLWVPR